MVYKILMNKSQIKQPKLNFMLMIMLIISTMITINSTSWISAWMGMEMNLMSFIPMMLTKNKIFKSSNSMMSYFMIQSSSSSILLLMIMMNKLEMNFFKINMLILFLQLSLLMKLGAAPFHWWTPKIINYLNWKNCFILLTWQKLAPFMMISMTKMSNLIYYSIITSSIIGAILGINQTSLKLMILYSSINHISWMMMSMMINMLMFMFYFIIYTISIMIICMMLNNLNLNFLNQLLKNNSLNMFNKINVMMMFLSMAGIPPMIGFLPKFKILMLMMNNKLMMESMIFILFSLITFLFYMYPLMSMMLFNKMNSKWNMMKFNLLKNNMLMILTNLTMSLMMIMPLLYL
uniref:NADH-ubiquinone oxidoreductase chain 2 n=1 Tax=Pseudoclavellaria amerinae TaxID=2798532 RepID=A0A977TJA1_9HYME|nr:NADH dehydrogenase subunit 2 [Pseudoclavellaria amerinae]UXW64316.1 NADH dehydrogenase subunit 2 [Pseudoclavellaria amerinae]